MFCYVAEKVVNEKSEIAILDGIEVKLVVLMHEIAKIGVLASNKKVDHKETYLWVTT